MKRGVSILLIIYLLLTCTQGVFAQDITNKGKDFWVGYGHHQYMEPGQANNQEMVLYFSAEQPANVTVTIQGRTAVQVLNYFVPANSVISSAYMPKAGPNDSRLYDVPPTFGGNGGEGLFGQSIHIESDVPIVAYAHIFGNVSSGSTMLMPVESWGYSYMSINSQQIDAAGPAFSWVYAIANHDNTVIEITPTVPTRLGKPANVPFTITLQKGQIYQFIGQSDGNGNGNQFTGSTVRSIANSLGECYPIAVFSGSSRTKGEQVPCGGSSGRDNDMQQCFPTQAWGKRYLTAPFSQASAPTTNVNLQASTFQTSVYKIVVKDPTTVVKRNGVVLSGLIIGKYYQFSSNTADYIESDKPIMIAQFMSKGSGCNTGSYGDPEMVFLSPMEQAIKSVGFYRNTRELIYANYVTVIIPTPGVASLRIDGSSSFNHTYAHPNRPGYSVVVKGWQAAQAQVIMSSDSAFTAITYGLGNAESYAYNAGTYLKNLNAVSSIQNVLDPATPQHQYTCYGTPVKISALMAYQPTRIDWLLSQLGPDISPNIDVTDMSPVLVGTTIQNGVTYYKYDLAGTYTFNRADTFFIPIGAYNPNIENCYLREDLKISVIVKPKPIAAFNFSHSGCELDTVYFNGIGTTSNNYTVRDYNWTFPGPTTATGQQVKKLLPAGTHLVNLSVVTQEGCVDDTTRTITVYTKPPAQFQITPPSLCVGNQFTITDTSSASIAVNQWYWDFGNSVTQNVTTGPSVTYTYPAAGTYTIKHVSKSSATCVSDTVTRIVQVFAKPVIGYNYTGGCLPPNGLVQFNSTSTTPDGQTLSYLWNFGDPNANGANPNTSTLSNPTHNYSVFGTYTIQLSVATSNGCTKDSTFTATFNLKPTLSYPALAPVCQSATGTVSIAAAAVTNGVPGTGIYSGPGTNAAGNFSPSLAGPGTHTIWYKFTTNGGCIDSVSQTILVRAKPVASFTNTTGCLPVNGQMQFTNASSIPDAQTLSYVWNFGDVTATSTLPNPSHNYAAEGTYNVKLTVTTNNGCVKDTTIAVAVSIKPQFQVNAALPSVCEDAPPLALTQIPVLNGVSGTGIYSGAGMSANNMFNPLIAGDGLHMIWYVFTTTGGCKDSVSTTINVHPKPASSFTVNTGICLDQSATLTNTSTISSGSINTWNWDFGDATNASYTNGNSFTKTYSNFNNYTISLVTVSTNGCKDTTTRNIAVHALPVANFSLPVSVCMPNGATTFTNQTTIGDNAALTYSWNFGDGSPLSNQTNPSHVYGAINSYTVTLISVSAFGCRDTTTKVMSAFFDKPIADFNVNPTSLCQGTDNDFTDLSTAPNSTVTAWNWNFGDGSNATIKNPTKRYARPGIYDVKLTVVNAVGCPSDFVTKQVTVYLQPVIDAGPSFVVAQGTIVQLKPTVNDSTVVSFTWSPSTNLSNPNTLRPLVNAVSDQTYTLTANGPGGCTATDNVSVKILKLVKPPNVFSPNGDGINDKWMISNLSDYPGAFVEIFNRYGQRIFYSASYNDPWDGTVSGKPLPVATYYYIITLKNGFEPLNGSVTILR